MYVAVRQYKGASALVDVMVGRSDDVRELLQGVEGFVAYYAARDGDAVTTVSVCEDRAGVDETTRRAAGWIKENMPDATFGPPTVSVGEVYFSI